MIISIYLIYNTIRQPHGLSTELNIVEKWWAFRNAQDDGDLATTIIATSYLKVTDYSNFNKQTSQGLTYLKDTNIINYG